MTDTKTIDQRIDDFFKAPAFAVAGASTNRDKYGNKVVRSYQQKGRTVFPIHPKEPEIEGIPTVKAVTDVPADEFALSIVTPPAITIEVVRQAIERNVAHIWMQPGAEEPTAIEAAEKAGISVIHDGPCVLVAQGYRE
ncbi:MAG: CoA-binding protein [Myxococcota bacterium]|nr:CoA-binding protein [Myxococcota bacterium]